MNNNAKDELVAAIRSITEDRPGGQPNNQVEKVLLDIEALLDPRQWRAGGDRQRARVSNAMVDLTSALIAQTKALRYAAEGYFGGDFGKPEEPT